MKSLRTPIILALLTVLALLGAVYFGIQQSVIYPSFVALEQQAAARDQERTHEAIGGDLTYLDISCRDWANWDDTYNFVVTGNQEFIDSNLGSASFTHNKLNLIFILDHSGRVVWGEIRDWHTAEPMKLAAFPEQDFPPDHPLLRFDPAQDLAEQNRSGLLMSGTTPVLLASRPILTSSNSGPSRGFLIMGRILDQGAVANLSSQTRVSFELRPLTATATPWDAAWLNLLATSSTPVLQEAGDQLLAFTVLRDLYGQPVLEVKTTLPRSISTQGANATAFSLLSYCLATVLMFVILLLMLRQIILQPLLRLTAHMHDIRDKGDLSRRLQLPRRDEIGLLATEFDRMLETLERQAQELNEKNTALEADALRRQEAEEALRALDKMKNEFISAAAHELNTPLAAITGYAEFLQHPEAYGGFDRNQQQDFVNEIVERCEALDKVVTDLLDISSYENDRGILLQKLECLPAEVIAPVVLRFQKLSGRHRFELRLEPTASRAVPMDRYRIGQVLENLISNAVKYSPQGGAIQVGGRVEGEMLVISVADEGVGMTPEQMEKVFEKFYRADTSNTAISGLGLGMSIAKRIVDSHQGHIWLESQVGQGSVFFFSLPA